MNNKTDFLFNKYGHNEIHFFAIADIVNSFWELSSFFHFFPLDKIKKILLSVEINFQLLNFVALSSHRLEPRRPSRSWGRHPMPRIRPTVLPAAKPEPEMWILDPEKSWIRSQLGSTSIRFSPKFKWQDLTTAFFDKIFRFCF